MGKKANFKELQALYSYFKRAGSEMAGYPCSHIFDYSALFHFLEFPINNVGDPFLDYSNYRVNTLKIERKVVDRFAELFHAPKDDYWGYVTNGGTEGNLYGLYVARKLYPDGIVFYSDQTHYSVAKNIDILRMDHVEIGSCFNGEIDYQELQKALIKEKRIPIIVANIGTTMKGAVDDVVRIKEILSDLKIEKYYIHCDAAFFGMILPFLPELEAQPFDFRIGIDSIAISGHKMIGTPIPCGVVLTKKSHVNKLNAHIEYIEILDRTIAGSRNGLTPLFLWYELDGAKKKKFKTVVNTCIERAGYAVKKFNQRGIPAWRNKNSMIVVFPKPSKRTIRKWQLASHNGLSHLITLAHISHKIIDRIVEQVVSDLKKKKRRSPQKKKRR